MWSLISKVGALGREDMIIRLVMALMIRSIGVCVGVVADRVSLRDVMGQFVVGATIPGYK